MTQSTNTENPAFRFAAACDGSFIDVARIDPGDRRRLEPFGCLSCGGRVVAALPKKRRRYFRHKGSRPEGCTNESYLHAAAKHAVAEAIGEAIRDRRPYNLFVTTPILCDRYQASFGLNCERRSRSFAYDLTQRFDEVGIEERVGRFSADILLRSSETGDRLLIEIAVTHPCSAEKIAAGERIVELMIQSEADIAQFKSGVDLASVNVRGFNFEAPLARSSRCGKGCNWIARAFFLDRDGTASIEVFDIAYLDSLARKSSTAYCRYIGKTDDYMAEGDRWNIMARECRRAVLSGQFDLKSCAICKHGKPSTIGKPVACAILGSQVHFADALRCPCFAPTIGGDNDDSAKPSFT